MLKHFGYLLKNIIGMSLILIFLSILGKAFLDISIFQIVPFLIIALIPFASYETFNDLSIEPVLSERQKWLDTLRKRSFGFPYLLEVIEIYDQKKDESLSNYLENKKHPAKKSADIVKEETRLRRIAEKDSRKTKLQIEYYESIAPFIIDFKDDLEEDESYLEEYTDEEKKDPAVKYLTKKQYRKLSSVKRNQLALDNYWKKKHSKVEIGKMYERYIGFLYETKGYDVFYHGITLGKGDLGRDLICKTPTETLIIQCKYWSQFKTIHEKHIFYFFGTIFEYKINNPNENIKGIFYCTTNLSALARKFCSSLDICLEEKYSMDREYPCVKCNISKSTNEKIYHLPFDQQYDKIKIEPEIGEFYCKTLKEAESSGFRRAYRWQGNKT